MPTPEKRVNFPRILIATTVSVIVGVLLYISILPVGVQIGKALGLSFNRSNPGFEAENARIIAPFALILFSVGMYVLARGFRRSFLKSAVVIVVACTLALIAPGTQQIAVFAGIVISYLAILVIGEWVNGRDAMRGPLQAIAWSALSFSIGMVEIAHSTSLWLSSINSNVLLNFAIGLMTDPSLRVFLYSLLPILWGILLLRPRSLPRFVSSPRSLPRLPKSTRGMSLIELLIVISIIAIIAPMYMHAVHTASIHSARARDEREAALVVSAEVERLRAGATPLVAGLTEKRESGELPMSITIAEPRADGLVPVSISITVGPPVRRADIVFDALIAPPEAMP